MNADQPNPSKPILRWYQYSLRSLFVLCTICAVLTFAGNFIWRTYFSQPDDDRETSLLEYETHRTCICTTGANSSIPPTAVPAMRRDRPQLDIDDSLKEVQPAPEDPFK